MDASSFNDPIVTFKFCAGPLQPLALATTEIIPPAVPTVALIELVIEDPVQSPGKLQVYELAPLTGVTVYVCNVPAITLIGPKILVGLAGNVFTIKLFA